MKLSLRRPALQTIALISASFLLEGCRAQSSYVSQANSLIVPATTNTLTNTASSTESSDQASTVSVPNANPQPATAKTFGEKLASGEAQLSESLAGIIKLAQGGVGEEVLLAYVQNSPTAFNLSAEEILYLTDLGISEPVISAMIQHKAGVAAQKPAPTTNAVAVAPSVVATNQLAVFPPVTDQIALPNAPSFAVTATPEFEAGAQPGVVASAPQVQYEYFYPTLAPYGNWFEVPDYGMVWQPTVAVVDTTWRPYCHRGRWIDSDCGWYWHSDYSWGWAPFHYGRWCNYPNRGWLWVPGSVWGPSWVTWRYSDAYCGWAPLPPGAYYDPGFGFRYRSGHVGISFDFGLGSDCYTFIPTARFCDPYPWRHRLIGGHVVNVFSRTTIINNYVQGPNKVIINHGVDRGKIAAITRSEIRKVEVRDAPHNAIRPIRPDRLERNGSEMVVYKPVSLAAPAEFVTTRAGQELRKATGPNANLEAGSRPSAASADSVPKGGGPRMAVTRGKASLQPNTGLAAESEFTAPQVNRIPSTRGESTEGVTVQGSPTSPALKTAAENRGASRPEARSVRSLNTSKPSPRSNHSGVAPVPENPAATASSPTSQVNESRGVASNDPKLIQTPIAPLQRRETLRSTVNASPVVPSRPNSPTTTVNSSRRPASEETASRTPGARSASDLEARLMEFQAANRAAPAPQPLPNERPTFRTRGLTERSAAAPSSQPFQGSYAVPPPSYAPQPPAYTVQPTPGPQYRQELPNRPTMTYPEKRSYSQPSPGPGYQPPSGYSPPSYAPTPSRGPSDYGSSVRSAPSSSGSISVVPSGRQGPPPTQISPSQMTPSPRSSSSSSSSGNSAPSRSSSSSNGRQTQER